MEGFRRLCKTLFSSIGRCGRALRKGLAYYPLTFYIGILLVAAAGFVFWAESTIGWNLDWQQLKHWVARNTPLLLILFSAALGAIMITSAMAYRQVVNLPRQEYALWLRQRGTRVFFPIFMPLHDWLRLRSRIYAWWHTHNFSGTAHFLILVVAIFSTVQYTIQSVETVKADGCPGTTTITVNTTWSTNQCLGDVTIRNGATLTINGGITADLESLSVGSDSPAENGFIVAKGDTLNNIGVVINTDGNVYVRASSSISGDGWGYTGGAASTNGNGPGPGIGGGSHGGGGAYGGNGGTAAPGTAGGSHYGAMGNPTQLGSGGGGGNGATGGNGGSAIKINALGTVTVNGIISADGAGGGASCCGGGGGGSGGSVWIIANTFDGSGTVRANGAAHGSRSEPGGGAGGRVDVDCTTNSSSITKQAFGGTQTSGQRGGAGTINVCGAAQIANNSANSSSSPRTGFSETSLTFTSLTVKDYAYLKLPSDLTTFTTGTTILENGVRVEVPNTATVWSGGSLTIQTGTNTVDVLYNVGAEPAFTSMNIASGTLTHTTGATADTYRTIFNVSGNIDVTGNISANGSGLAGGSGSQAGYGTGGGSTGTHGGGGGYGAAGGNSSFPGNGGIAYGSITAPTAVGSGGGGASSAVGGSGGGAIKLTSGGTTTIAGTISANGSNGTASCCNAAGGGSGGSVYITTSALAGSGTITSNGGTNLSHTGGGAGAGGRIAVICSSTTASLTTQAFGGNQSSGQRGGPGTKYLCNGSSYDFTVANDTANSTTSPTTTISSSLTLGSFTVKDYSIVSVDNSINIAGGTTVLKNNSKITLAGTSTVWSGGTFTIGTDATTNTINVPKTVTTKPLFSSITVGSGTLQHDTHTTSHTNSLILKSTGNVDVTGTISANGKGFSGGGTGASGNGTGGGAGNTTHGGGAGYGAAGGTSTTGSAGGSSYGSGLIPVDLGSGGGGGSGGGTGGAGGGAIELQSGATITISGTVSANGSNGTSSCCNGGGGGSGGSVWLVADVIDGNGTVTANGGGNPVHTGAGCGAGGRVGRDYRSNTFSGTLTALKGTSCTSGSDGTTLTVGPVTHYTVSGHASPVTAGTSGSVTVTALDASNNQNHGYTKTVVFSSSDSQATLPSNYAFTITDAGAHTFTNGITLKTAGSQSVTIDQSDDGSIDGTQSSITVNPGSAAVLTVTGIDDPIVAGVADTAVVTAKDTYSNTATGYTGTVTFTSNDTQAILPSNYAFVGGDSGVKSFTNGVTLKTAGERTVTATDTVTGSITGTQSAITVTPAAASSLTLSGITTPTVAGDSHSPVVTAKDAYQNTATGYTGTVAFTSTDPSAELPAAYVFTGSDNGTKTFTSGVKLKTAGNRTVTVTDTGNGSLSVTSGTIAVSPGLPSKFIISGVTSPILTGSASSVIVEVQDILSNRVTGYTGTVAFSSTDGSAVLPTNYAFVVGDAGLHTFSSAVTFNTAGSQSLTATDVSTPAVTGTLAGISVTAPAVPASSGSNSGSNSSSNSSAGSSSAVSGTAPIQVTFVIIDPATGTFSGIIQQQVGGVLLDVQVTGVVSGSTISGTVTGVYGSTPVNGSITGTVKNNKITTAQITLFSSLDSQFSLTVFVGGDIQSSSTKPNKKNQCVIEGAIQTVIDGKSFTGTLKFSILDDGSLEGTAKGVLDGHRVSGSFKASGYEAEIVGGTVTLAQAGGQTPITGDIVGQIDSGEIQLISARNCTLPGKVEFTTIPPSDTTDPGDGSADTIVTLPDGQTVTGGNSLTIPVSGTMTESANPNTAVLVKGTAQTELGDLALQPLNPTYQLKETRDLSNGILAVIAGISTLPLLPLLQNEILTSSIRHMSLPSWFFFAYLPRRKRKFWGVIRDSVTKVPVAGVLIKLVALATGQMVREQRTDRTGRYGFIVEAPGQYSVNITDPLYQAYQGQPLTIADPQQAVVSQNIELTPMQIKSDRSAKTAYRLLTLLTVLGYFHWPILVIGTGLSLYLALSEPNLARTLIMMLYLFIWLTKLFGYRRERHVGLVTDENNQPLAKCVVQLTTVSQGTDSHVLSTITDDHGRFIILVKPGTYDMIVAKEGFAPRHGAVIADEANMVIRLKKTVQL